MSHQVLPEQFDEDVDSVADDYNDAEQASRVGFFLCLLANLKK